MAQGWGFLRKETIEKLVAEEGAIQGSVESGFKQWSYDLRLGSEVFLSSDKTLRQLRKGGSILIRPGEFALLTTEEKVKIPLTHVGFISLKFSYALKGLVNISGFHVDPGFEGTIVFSVYNAGPNPVAMRREDPAFMLIFAPLDDQADPRQKEAAIFPKIDRLKSDWISAVKGPAVSLTRLNSRVNRLRDAVTLLTGLVIALLTSLIVAFII